MADDQASGGSIDSELEDNGLLDSADSLDGELGDDALDAGYTPAERWSAAERFGTTLNEERTGESLDQLLAEEEPDVDPYAEDGESGDPDDPRAGRLVAEDEGAHEDKEADLVARDSGRDGGGESAEESAMHVVDGD